MGEQARPRVYDNVAAALQAAASPFAKARILLAVTAYPGKGAGLPASENGKSRDGKGVKFAAAMADYALWVRKQTVGRKQLLAELGEPDRVLNEPKNWERTYFQGISRIRACDSAESAYSYAVGRVHGLDRIIKTGWRRGDEWPKPKPFSVNAALNDLPEFWAERLATYPNAWHRNPDPDTDYMRKKVFSFRPVFHLIRALRPIALESRRWVPSETLTKVPLYEGFFPPNLHQHTPLLLAFPERWVERAIDEAERIRLEALAAYEDPTLDEVVRLARRADLAPYLIQLR